MNKQANSKQGKRKKRYGVAKCKEKGNSYKCGIHGRGFTKSVIIKIRFRNRYRKGIITNNLGFQFISSQLCNYDIMNTVFS